MLVRASAAVIAFLALFFADACMAQVQQSIIVSQPSAGLYSLFIRVSAPPGGTVLCPQASRHILGANQSANTIVLRVDNTITPGGFPFPYCDSNVVQLGPLADGVYLIEARLELAGGALGPSFASTQLVVGAAPVNVEPIPTMSEWALLLTCVLILSIGTRSLRR